MYSLKIYRNRQEAWAGNHCNQLNIEMAEYAQSTAEQYAAAGFVVCITCDNWKVDKYMGL